jgi:hypothetical protein
MFIAVLFNDFAISPSYRRGEGRSPLLAFAKIIIFCRTTSFSAAFCRKNINLAANYSSLTPPRSAEGRLQGKNLARIAVA